jgi:hypothetical protein
MAGANSLVTQHYPNDFQIVTVPFVAAASTSDPVVFMYADRDLVIDSVVVGIIVPGGGNGRLNIEEATAPNSSAGTIICSFNIDGGNNAAAGDTIISDTDSVVRIDAAGDSQNVGASTKINNANNLIQKGRWVMIDFENTFAAFRGTVQIRFRSMVA